MLKNQHFLQKQLRALPLKLSVMICKKKKKNQPLF